MRMTFSPDKTNSPLFVDTNRMLPVSLAPQSFQPVTWRHTKIVESSCIIQQAQFPQRDRLNIWREPSAAPAFPDRRGFDTAKANDHEAL
jgi:hypothetical protein